MGRKLLLSVITALFLSAAYALESAPESAPESARESASTEPAPATSNETPAQDSYSEFYGMKVRSVNFLGLKKTKNAYLQPKVKKIRGSQFSEKTLVELEKILQIEGLFDEISFNVFPVSESEVDIEVFLKEKLTFLPLPFAAYSSSGAFGGIMIFDTNAFGMKDTFLAGGFFSKETQSGLLAFSKSPKDNFVPGFRLSFSAARNTKKIQKFEPHDDDDFILKYKSTDISASVALAEKITEQTNASLGISFTSLKEKDIKGYEDIVDSIKIMSVFGDLNYSKSDWNGWFISSINASLSGKISFTNDSNYQYGQIYSARFSLQKPILPRLRFLSQASGTIGKNNHISLYSGRGAASSTIISDKFVSQRLAGASSGLEFAAAKLRFGTISVYANYEGVIAQDYDGKYNFNHGFNCGSKLYLSKLAVPALAMGLSYNVVQKKLFYSLAMGVSM